MNKFEERSIKSYDEKAADYTNSPEGRYTQKFKDLLFTQVNIPNGGTLLDVACGNGTFLRQLEQNHSFDGYGVDISPKMVKSARMQNPNMAFFESACETLPFKNGFFDVLTICAAFHHFPSPTLFAKEAFRVLKRGGELYLAEIYYPAFLIMLANPFVPLSKAGDVRFYTPKQLQNIFTNAGFLSVDVETINHIQILTVKK